MDILTYLVVIEMLRLHLTASEFNSLPDDAKVRTYNTVRFNLKSQLSRHPDIVKIIDKRIADILFAGCPE